MLFSIISSVLLNQGERNIKFSSSIFICSGDNGAN